MLASCDAHAGVRLTLHRLREAGTLVAIASAHPFRYGSENVTRQGRHPQLHDERVADLTYSVSRRNDSVYEVALDAHGGEPGVLVLQPAPAGLLKCARSSP